MAELLANKSVFTMDGSHAPSCVTSVFNSASGVYVDELRATRKTINVDRRKLEAWFTRLAGPEAKQADIEDEFSDHDLARDQWMKNVEAYVEMAREHFLAGNISEMELKAFAESLNPHGPIPCS